MFEWLRRRSESRSTSANNRSVAIVGDNVNSPINIGSDKEEIRSVFQEEISKLSRTSGVPEAPLRAILKKLGETRVPRAQIPARLAAAADELIRLRADLARLREDRPEFAAIRARAAMLIDKGEFDAARAALQEGSAAARVLRVEFSRAEAEFLVGEARIHALQLNYEAACHKFAEAGNLDPDNCWIWIEFGDLWMVRGSLKEAEEPFRAAIGAARRSGEARDLSVSYDRIGDVQVAQGDLAGALTSFRDSLAIAERLARSDPGNAGWQRDLSVSYNKIGEVQVAQGDLAGALTSFRDSLAIRDRLARSDPGNAGWQRDLMVSCVKIAGAVPDEAKPMLTKALAIANHLKDEGRLAPVDAWIPDELRRRLAALGN